MSHYGTKILSVDGRPANEVRAELAHKLPLFTPHGSAAYSAAFLLRGPADRTVNVKVRLPTGEEQIRPLARTVPRLQRPPLQVRVLAKGLLHVEINAMSQDALDRFEERFPSFDEVRGMIVDLRWNQGGSFSISNALMARLLTERARASQGKTRVYIPWVRAGNGGQKWLQLHVGDVVPSPERPSFNGPLAVLTSSRTGSAAEDFLGAYLDSKRGPVIGEPSAGSTGQGMWIPLPGGGLFQVCTVRCFFPDGTDFVGTGVMPTIPCSPTIAGFCAGRDEVLERAVTYLESGA